MREPWGRPPRRFGFLLGKTPDKNQGSLGWAVVNLGWSVQDKGETPADDPIAATIQQYRRMEALRGPGDGVTLYDYDARTFAGSRAAAEGLTLDQHRANLDAAERRLSESGIKVRRKKGKP